MHKLRTCFNKLFIGSASLLWLFFSTLAAMPVFYFKRKERAIAVRKFVFIQSKGIVFFMRLCSKSWRTEAVPRPKSPCIIAANHASVLDLYTVSAFGFDNVVYLTKGWVFTLPLFRYIMDGAGYIDVEKTSPADLLEHCRKAVEKGCDIVVFPQGSRKDPYARFKSGAFYLARELNLPVIPMAIVGTHKMLPAGDLSLKSADIVLKIFPAVYPADFSGELGHLHMAQAVKKQIMDFVQKEISK